MDNETKNAEWNSNDIDGNAIVDIGRKHGLGKYVSEVSIPGKYWRGAFNSIPFISNRHMEILVRKPIPKGQMAIGNSFAIVLNDDGYLTFLGKNNNFKQFSTSERIVKVAATSHGYMGLTDGGRIVVGTLECEFEPVVSRWSGVKDIVGCEDHVLAINSYGNVLCIDGPGDWTFRPLHENVVRNWVGIKQVAAGFANVMGLTRDGKILYHSEDKRIDEHFYDSYSDIVQVDCYSHFYGMDSAMALHSNGKVSSDTFDGVDKWRNIVQISVGDEIAIGLKCDGTIEMAIQRSNLENLYEAKNWKDLVSVECKFWGIVGITKSGQILSLFR